MRVSYYSTENVYWRDLQVGIKFNHHGELTVSVKGINPMIVDEKDAERMKVKRIIKSIEHYTYLLKVSAHNIKYWGSRHGKTAEKMLALAKRTYPKYKAKLEELKNELGEYQRAE